jgi:hypothetical protein
MKKLLLGLTLLTSMSAFSYYEDGTCVLMPSFEYKETKEIYKGSEFKSYVEYAINSESREDCSTKAKQLLTDDLDLGYQVISKIDTASMSSNYENVIHWEYVTGSNPFTANFFNPNGFISRDAEPKSE